VTVGRALASLGLPTLLTLEGGYAVAEFGVNTVNVLEGFQSGR
jgi:acetoin utilization deacetylase AcuC-like enzyme